MKSLGRLFAVVLVLILALTLGTQSRQAMAEEEFGCPSYICVDGGDSACRQCCKDHGFTTGWCIHDTNECRCYEASES